MSRSAANLVQRVAHLTSVHTVRDVRIFQKECVSLSEAGYDVVVVGIGDSSRNPSEPEIIGLTAASSRIKRMTLTTMSVLRAGLRSKASIFHLHDPELIPAGLFLKMIGRRVIFDCHEFVIPDLLEKSYLPAAIKRLVAWFVQGALFLADTCFDAIIVAAPANLRGFRNRNAIVINNYAEWEVPEVLPSRFADRGPILAYTGMIVEERGIQEIVRALEIVARRTPVTLLLAGEFQSPELLDKMRQLPGWRHVDYRGQVARTEVRQILDQSVAGLVIFHDIGNHRENSPNKLFEYMARGLPTIMSDFPAWKERFGPTDACLCVDPYDPEAIAEKITYLITNRAQAEEMGKNALHAARTTFHWNVECEKLLELYARLIGKPVATRTQREEIVPICAE